MGPFGSKKACISELGQLLAAPQAESLAQSGRRRRHLAVGGEPLSLRDLLLEADDVDLAGSDGQGIAGLGGEDRRWTSMSSTVRPRPGKPHCGDR
jgi:hypothetical protein